MVRVEVCLERTRYALPMIRFCTNLLTGLREPIELPLDPPLERTGLFELKGQPHDGESIVEHGD